MAPREKEESAKTHDSYGTMTYAGDENDNESGNDNGNVGMTPVETTGRITGNANTNPIDTCSYDYDYEYKCNSNNDSYDYLLPIETAIERVGTGAFQHKILLATGLCFMADAMEVLLLSFLSTVLKHEWNLSEGEVDSIIAVVFAGGLLGTVVLGRAGDVWGRKPVFAVTALLIGTAGVATAFCRTYQELLLARFWVGFGVGGLTVPFDILGEFLPGAARGKNLLYIEFFWCFGTLSVPTLAYLTLDTSADGNGNYDSHWPLFVILCSIPCFLSAFFGLILVPESPRWLLEESLRDKRTNQTGMSDYSRTKALEILKSAARANGISQSKIDKELFPPNTRLVLSLDEAQNSRSAHDESTSEEANNNNFDGFGELFRTPQQTRLTILLWATWFGFGFLYYGVIIAVSLVFITEEDETSNKDDDGNGVEGEYQNTLSYGFDFAAIFVTSSAEIFGLIAVLFTIDSIGRIPSQTIAYRIGGLSTFLLGLLCILESGTSSFHRYSLIGLAFVSRMAMMASSCTTWVSTSEMLSTEIRSTGHGAANAMARLGGFVAPYLITEGNSMETIGILVLLVALFTAECANKLPETAGKPMGDVSTTTGKIDLSEDCPKPWWQKNIITATKKPSIDNDPSNSYHELLY